MPLFKSPFNLLAAGRAEAASAAVGRRMVNLRAGTYKVRSDGSPWLGTLINTIPNAHQGDLKPVSYLTATEELRKLSFLQR